MTGSEKRNFQTVSVSRKLLDTANERYIGQDKIYGYKTNADFLNDAMRRRIEHLEQLRRCPHCNKHLDKQEDEG